ncbi:MAG: hypothetical protein CM15mP109_10610 [Candidatus Dadabacteria bacterium]|nr:MAG: hypothetical protein CM15mP109_10610 [Candidatus Dadabacteria bacterium]
MRYQQLLEKAKEEQDNGALIIDTREINELALTGKNKILFIYLGVLKEFQNKETNPNGIEGFTKDKKLFFIVLLAQGLHLGKALKILALPML